MRIVKQFEDREMLYSIYHWCSDNELFHEHFYWGLGEDGELYCRCTRWVGDEWRIPSSVNDIGKTMNLKLMRRIVKEFGHLVVFT